MSRFRIRPEDCLGSPAFVLEEEVAGFFGRTSWERRDREVVYVYPDENYEAKAVTAIADLRKAHKRIMAKRGVMVKHLETPIIYLEDVA